MGQAGLLPQCPVFVVQTSNNKRLDSFPFPIYNVLSSYLQQSSTRSSSNSLKQHYFTRMLLRSSGAAAFLIKFHFPAMILIATLSLTQSLKGGWTPIKTNS